MLRMFLVFCLVFLPAYMPASQPNQSASQRAVARVFQDFAVTAQQHQVIAAAKIYIVEKYKEQKMHRELNQAWGEIEFKGRGPQQSVPTTREQSDNKIDAEKEAHKFRCKMLNRLIQKVRHRGLPEFSRQQLFTALVAQNDQAWDEVVKKVKEEGKEAGLNFQNSKQWIERAAQENIIGWDLRDIFRIDGLWADFARHTPGDWGQANAVSQASSSTKISATAAGGWHSGRPRRSGTGSGLAAPQTTQGAVSQGGSRAGSGMAPPSERTKKR